MKFSIIVPAYNAASFIDAALASLQRQTCGDWEALIVDDCSSDATRATVQRWVDADPRFRLIAQRQNGGPARARNAGFDAARGEWIALLDADDLWQDDRLERFLPHLDDADLACDRLLLYNAAQERVVAHSWPWVRAPRTLRLADLLLWDMPGQRAPIGWAKPLLRRAWLNRQQLRYREELRAGEDWRLLVDALMAGARARLLPYAGYRYTLRLADKNFSQTKVDYSAPRQLNREVASVYGRRWPALCRLVLPVRGWLIGGLATKAQLKPAWHARRWSAVAKVLLTSPGCWGVLLVHQCEKLLWRR